MNVHRALFDIHIIAPDLVQQLAAAVYALGVAHEVAEQFELHGPQLEHLALVADLVGGTIHPQLPHLQHLPQAERVAPAQHGADARQQLLHRKGLGNVVIGPGIQTGDFVRLIAAGREHQDGHLLGARLAAPMPGQLQATFAARQHPVQHDQVGHARVQRCLGLGAVLGAHGGKTMVAQVDGNQFSDRRFILHDQHLGQLLHGRGGVCSMDTICSTLWWRTSLPSTR